MKQNYLKELMTVLLLLCCTVAGAEAFEVDGIYYNILPSEDKTVEVTSGSNEYSGAVTIPASVTYNSITYSVTSIGYDAFRSCTGLTSIEIPSSVTSIGDYAFYYCYGLTSIEIPSSVTSIGQSAFGACWNLTSIEIPSSVTSIGGHAFNCCYGLTSIEISSSVTSIGNNAFYHCTGLTSIEIPSSVTSIGYNVFEGCTGLTSIVIPSSVTSIGQWAFDGCTGLTSIVIPESVTSIGESAFAYCYGLTSIVIPSSVTSIGESAFRGCDGLTSIVVDEGNTIYDSRNNCNAIIETASNTLIAGFVNTIIPEGVTSIGNSAFAGCGGLTSIEIPSSVTSIGNSAFESCIYLTSIEIPNSVTSIGESAFRECYGLTSVEIPSSVTSIGNSAFYYCYSLTSIEIPGSVTSIDNSAFIYCWGLTSIVSHIAAEDLFAIIAETFSGIDKDACTLYVPAGAKSTYAATDGWKEFTNIVEFNGKCGDNAYWALNEETGALTIFGEGAMYNYANNDANRAPWYSNKENISTVTIEEGVISIGESAFADCDDLTSSEIPSSVTSIGEYAFAYCWNLTSIEIPSSVTSIGEWAFFDCDGLTSIEIPSSVTSIGDYAFSDCGGLTSIVVDEGNTIYDSRNNCNAIIKTASNTLIAGCVNTIIPEGVTSIGNSAFFGCDLTSIEIPSSVTSIGEWAFFCCYGLTSIEIPASVTSIGQKAFVSCYGLTSIEIPSSVTSIGEGAFSDCFGLTSIVVDDGNTIYDSRNNCNAIIETASNNLIAGCKNTIIPEGVTSIGESAFGGCYGLTSIEIPSSVTSIGDYAFENSGLKRIISYIAAEDLFAPGVYAFSGIDNEACTLYVPAGAAATYAATDGWSNFTNIVEMSPAGYSLTVTAAGYATMYLDKAVEIPAGVEAYTANRVEGDLLKMQAVEDVIPANTAVIIKANEGTYSFAYSVETPEAISDNLLRGTVADTYVKPQSGSVAYVLSMVDGVVGMYRAKLTDGTFKNNANRAYMLLSELNVGDGNLDTSAPGSQLSNGYRFDFSGTTAIESVETESTAPAVYYDLSGRRVENPAKGIYIVNGKKVYIK